MRATCTPISSSWTWSSKRSYKMSWAQILRMYDECIIRHKNSFLPERTGKYRDIREQFFWKLAYWYGCSGCCKRRLRPWVTVSTCKRYNLPQTQHYTLIVQPTRCTCYFQLFILVKRSTCFGRPSVHHQELKTAYTATV